MWLSLMNWLAAGHNGDYSVIEFDYLCNYHPFILMGLMVIFIVIPLAAPFQRSESEDKSLLLDGEDFLRAGGDRQTKEDHIQNALVINMQWASKEWTLRRGTRTHRFWAFCCFNFLEGLGSKCLLPRQLASFA